MSAPASCACEPGQPVHPARGPVWCHLRVTDPEPGVIPIRAKAPDPTRFDLDAVVRELIDADGDDPEPPPGEDGQVRVGDPSAPGGWRWADPPAALNPAAVERVTRHLLESDALTPNGEPSDGLFTVHEADVEHLVRTVLTAMGETTTPVGGHAPDAVSPDAVAKVLAEHAWSAVFGGCREPCEWQSSEGPHEQDEHAAHVADALVASGALAPTAEQRDTEPRVVCPHGELFSDPCQECVYDAQDGRVTDPDPFLMPERDTERVEALLDRWETDLGENRCPSCHASPESDCDHGEGYHHALSDLRNALGREP